MDTKDLIHLIFTKLSTIDEHIKTITDDMSIQFTTFAITTDANVDYEQYDNIFENGIVTVTKSYAKGPLKQVNDCVVFYRYMGTAIVGAVRENGLLKYCKLEFMEVVQTLQNHDDMVAKKNIIYGNNCCIINNGLVINYDSSQREYLPQRLSDLLKSNGCMPIDKITKFTISKAPKGNGIELHSFESCQLVSSTLINMIDQVIMQQISDPRHSWIYEEKKKICENVSNEIRQQFSLISVIDKAMDMGGGWKLLPYVAIKELSMPLD